MVAQVVLMKQRIEQLEKQNEELTKRKSRKRKRIQQGGTLNFSVGAQAAAEDLPAAQASGKRARGDSGANTTQPTRRRCGRCGETGHNARTCNKVEEEASELDVSTVYIFSDDSV
jgi:hypothetical protein